MWRCACSAFHKLKSDFCCCCICWHRCWNTNKKKTVLLANDVRGARNKSWIHDHFAHFYFHVDSKQWTMFRVIRLSSSHVIRYNADCIFAFIYYILISFESAFCCWQHDNQRHLYRRHCTAAVALVIFNCMELVLDCIQLKRKSSTWNWNLRATYERRLSVVVATRKQFSREWAMSVYCIYIEHALQRWSRR